MALVRTNDIAMALYEATHGKSGNELSLVLEHAVQYLKENNLFNRTDQILSRLEAIIHEKEGKLKASVTTKYPLSKKSRSDIEAFLKDRYSVQDIILEEHQDDQVLGGMKIQVGNDVIDLSLKHKVETLQAYLLQN